MMDTRAMRQVILTCILSWSAWAQTTVYLRHGEPGSAVQITGATNATPIEITTSTPHQLTAGQRIWIQGVQGNFAANGARLVKAVTSANKFTITEINNVDVAGSGAYAKNTDAVVGPTQPVTLQEHPRVWLDGPNGPLTTNLATKAFAGNPAWDAITAAANRYNPIAGTIASYDGVATNTGSPVSALALRWYLTGDQAALAATKDWINNVERIISTSAASGGHFGCDETTSTCGAAAAATDYPVFYLQHIALAYSLIRPQLTADERRTFADKIFNDNPFAYSTTQPACTNQAQPGTGTISSVAGSYTLNYTDDSLDNLVAGDYVWLKANSLIALVTAVNPDTNTITVYRAARSTTVDSTYLLIRSWKSGDCGYIWKLKHHAYWPGPMATWNRFGGTTSYPTQGGNYAAYLHNHVISRAYHAMAISIALADDDPRAREMLEMSYNFFFDRPYSFHRSYWSGPAQVDEGYYLSRVAPAMVMAMPTIRNSLVSPVIDLFSDGWLKNLLLYYIYGYMPHRADRPRYGAPSGNGLYMGGTSYAPLIGTLWMYGGTPEAAFAYKFLRDIAVIPSGAPVWSSGSLAQVEAASLVFADPSAPATDYTGLSLQKNFNAAPVVQFPTRNTSVMISRTGWPSSRSFTNDTWTWLYAPDQHTTGLINIKGAPGNYEIAKNIWLIGDDNGPDSCTPELSCYGSDLDKTSYIEIGGTDNLIAAIGGPVVQNAEISRFAGDSQNRYAYGMADLTGVYKPTVGAVRVHRHFLDLKKPGTPQYIVVYDDVQTATPQMKRTFLQYSQNGGTGEGNTFYDDASGTIRSLAPSAGILSKVLLPASPTMFTDVALVRCSAASPTKCPNGATTNSLLFAKNASEAFPYIFQSGSTLIKTTEQSVITLGPAVSGTAYIYLTPDGKVHAGHNGLAFLGLSALLGELGVTAFPPGVIPIAVWTASNGVWATEGAYSGITLSSSAGQSRRFLVSDGVTMQSEFLMIHMPTVVSTPEFPAATLLDIPGGEFRGVQIDGNDAKVVVFSRGGVLKTGVSFTTSFTGTGTSQIFIAGLAAGTYRVRLNGATLLPAVTVNDADNTMYFEAPSGVFEVSQIGTPQPLAIATPNLPDGTVSVLYAHALNASGGVPPYTWSVINGNLPEGVALTVEGGLQGTPAREGEYPFTVQVQDTGSPASTATALLVLNVLPEPPKTLEITVDAITPFAAMVHYGMPGLDANLSCTLQLATDNLFNSVVESFSDSGGAAIREYIFGQFVPLVGNTTYYAKVVCGMLVAMTQFLTPLPDSSPGRRFPVSVRPPAGLHVASVLIEYGTTPALGSQVQVSCSPSCAAEISGQPHSIVFLRRTYLGTSNQVLARSKVQAVKTPF